MQATTKTKLTLAFPLPSQIYVVSLVAARAGVMQLHEQVQCCL